MFSFWNSAAVTAQHEYPSKLGGSPRADRAWPLAWPSPSGPAPAHRAAFRRDEFTAPEAAADRIICQVDRGWKLRRPEAREA